MRALILEEVTMVIIIRQPEKIQFYFGDEWNIMHGRGSRERRGERKGDEFSPGSQPLFLPLGVDNGCPTTKAQHFFILSLSRATWLVPEYTIPFYFIPF
jgi:hypothetical protein